MNFSKKVLFHTRRFFYPYLIIDSLLCFKNPICICTVHQYRPSCFIISSLTCLALGCRMNMWIFRPPARWAHGLLWWPRTAINNNVVFCLVNLYCRFEIKFTTTITTTTTTTTCTTTTTEGYGGLSMSWRGNDRETISALLAICEEIHRSKVDSLTNGQLLGAFVFSLLSAWTRC